ncbi:MAG: sigma 54-interacting transcriptional regulator [Phycisphaerales bacterium]|nr:sigma 54-interacting transcriptional regulator [Phycisphaerales bacterium]
MEDINIEYREQFESLRDLLASMVSERSVDALLNVTVEHLAADADLVAAAIWLIRPSDMCDSCVMAPVCPDQGLCLHLMACAGQLAGQEIGPDNSGPLSTRVPLGVGYVGRVAASGEFEIADGLSDDIDLPSMDPDALISGHGGGFISVPMNYRGALLGTLGLFTGGAPPRGGYLLGRQVIANIAAGAIANATAFEEIQRLRQKLELENEYLRQEISAEGAFGEMVGQSPALQGLQRQIRLVAPTDASVLILGESGTGKELVAREIHRQSKRNAGPMIKVNCAAIPRELYESEFFGHVKGSFTGAVADRAGRFEAADGGTLFLDEVGEIPLDMQTKLLRVLQEGQYERIGDENTRQVNVRIVAATNRDLKGDVDAKQFREDLYYRLNVFPVEVAPLRERREDIPLLAEHFLQLTCRKMNRRPLELLPAVLDSLQQHPWPGNIRELQNVIERAVITAHDGVLRIDLPRETQEALKSPGDSTDGAPQVITDDEIRQLERRNIIAALRRTKWKIGGRGGAAELLAIRPTTLASRMKAMKIERPV